MGALLSEMKLGYFTRFAHDNDVVLLQCTPDGFRTLTALLGEFVRSHHEEWPVHNFAFVSGKHQVKLFASRSDSSSSSGFRWRCSHAELPSIQGILKALGASGSGHQYFDLAGCSAELIVSAGEYP